MSKFTTLIRRAPKRFTALVAVLVAAIVIPAVAFAWGPSRDTFTMADPADHVTFNSITDNSVVGDERNFVVVKDAANTNDGGWQDDITVEEGKEYLVRMYVHNNAADNLNLVATNTRVMASVPNTTGKNVAVSGFVTADNATPNKVWDDISFNSDKDFNLTYVAGSAEIYNNGYASGGSGASLPDSIVTSTGALIGYDGPDGNVPGCFQYVNYVYFKVKVQFPTESFTVSKDVRKSGEVSFVESVNTNAGADLNYRIIYKNTGNMQANNVILKDTLPENVSYVPGSVKIMNANNPSGAYVQDGDKLFSSGINIGSYTAGSNALVIFNAKIDSEDKLEKCGTNTLVNVASAQPEGSNPKEDNATVTVEKECVEPEPEVKYTCDLLTVKPLSRTEFKFTTKYSVENATFKGVVYTIRDANGTVIDTKATTGTEYTYTQETTGKYTVQAAVSVEVDGKLKTVTSDDCKAAFEVTKLPGEITVCELETNKVITIKEDEFDSEIHSKNLADCEEVPVTIRVCDLTTSQLITINEDEFDSDQHSKTLSDCDDEETPEVPETPETPEVPTTPETPAELPETGVGESIAAVIGLGALITSLGYYIASRRALHQ